MHQYQETTCQSNFIVGAYRLKDRDQFLGRFLNSSPIPPLVEAYLKFHQSGCRGDSVVRLSGRYRTGRCQSRACILEVA